MKKGGWIAVIVAAVVIAGAIIWAVTLRGRSERSGPQTAEVARRTLSVGIEALGAVQPRGGAEVRVGARVSGRVEQLYANVGDVVERGELIAQLDDDELAARVERARADLTAAEEKWGEARAAAGAAPEQTAAAVEEARSSVEAARARLRQTEATRAQNRNVPKAMCSRLNGHWRRPERAWNRLGHDPRRSSPLLMHR